MTRQTALQLPSICDGVFVVDFTGYRTSRTSLFWREMQRVGLETRVQTVWQFPTPYDELYRANLPVNQALRTHLGWWSCSCGQYAMLKTALEQGCRAALLLENDCRFLRDIDYVNSALAHPLPAWDILMLDSFAHRGVRFPKNSYWSTVSAAKSNAAYLVNRRAMQRLIQIYETPAVRAAVQPLRVCDEYIDQQILGQDISIQVAWPNLAIQACEEPQPSVNGSKALRTRYQRELKIDLANYYRYCP